MNPGIWLLPAVGLLSGLASLQIDPKEQPKKKAKEQPKVDPIKTLKTQLKTSLANERKLQRAVAQSKKVINKLSTILA